MSKYLKVNPTLTIQRVIVGTSILLFFVKVFAYYYTNSLAVLTDALESIVNIVASIIGMYSIKLSLKPRDKDHPYGHRKIEFITSAFEGILICLAGIFIIYEAMLRFQSPILPQKLDLGFLILSITAVINLLLGLWCKKNGKMYHSPVLDATGSHLITDTFTTIGISVGIILIYFTEIFWLDSILAIFFATFIIYSGYLIIKKSISGMMDELDQNILQKILGTLNDHREKEWIDIHNLRIIDYAGFYHVDCHLTVPYYYTVQEAHEVVENIDKLLNKKFENNFEFFIHTDPCIEKQCFICTLMDCPKRQHKFVEKVNWTEQTIISNTKHTLNSI